MASLFDPPPKPEIPKPRGDYANPMQPRRAPYTGPRRGERRDYYREPLPPRHDPPIFRCDAPGCDKWSAFEWEIGREIGRRCAGHVWPGFLPRDRTA